MTKHFFVSGLHPQAYAAEIDAERIGCGKFSECSAGKGTRRSGAAAARRSHWRSLMVRSCAVLAAGSVSLASGLAVQAELVDTVRSTAETAAVADGLSMQPAAKLIATIESVAPLVASDAKEPSGPRAFVSAHGSGVGDGPPVASGLIDSHAALHSALAVSPREALAAALEREDIRIQLEAYGISLEEAQARVGALTDAEVATLAASLDEIPAGAGVSTSPSLIEGIARTLAVVLYLPFHIIFSIFDIPHQGPLDGGEV